jgi:hypothetical protein
MHIYFSFSHREIHHKDEDEKSSLRNVVINTMHHISSKAAMKSTDVQPLLAEVVSLQFSTNDKIRVCTLLSEVKPNF